MWDRSNLFDCGCMQTCFSRIKWGVESVDSERARCQCHGPSRRPGSPGAREPGSGARGRSDRWPGRQPCADPANRPAGPPGRHRRRRMVPLRVGRRPHRGTLPGLGASEIGRVRVHLVSGRGHGRPGTNQPGESAAQGIRRAATLRRPEWRPAREPPSPGCPPGSGVRAFPARATGAAG